jgi:HK97 gp10 family phage protein
MIATLDKKQLAAVRRMLALLPKRIRNKVLRQELRKAAKALVAPSKAATPVRTGKLRKSVKVRAAKVKRGVGVNVGYSDKNFVGDTFYGAFLEFGWKIGKRQSSAATRQGIPDTRREVPGKRYLGKVAEQYGPELLNKATLAIAKRVEQEAKNA